MPVLIAIAEVLADPADGVEHSGDTTGGHAQIVLSGPVIKRLGFNVENGAMREGTRANTSVGRFLRLFLRNVAGCLPGAGDKSTFGNPTRVVLAEHEAELAALRWPLFAEDRGFAAGTNLVTIGRFTSSGVVGSIYGADPDVIAAYLADGLVRHTNWEAVFIVGFAPGIYRPLLAISPMVAKTLARAGWSKDDLRQAFFRHARLPAEKLETYFGPWTNLVHGSPGDGRAWSRVVSRLVGRVRILAPDLPGYGGSDPLPARGAPTAPRDGGSHRRVDRCPEGPGPPRRPFERRQPAGHARDRRGGDRPFGQRRVG